MTGASWDSGKIALCGLKNGLHVAHPPLSLDLWAWPALLETKMEHDLHANHASRYEALLLALLCSCFPLLAYEVPRQLDFPWTSLFISWIHTLYYASESYSVPSLGALT